MINIHHDLLWTGKQQIKMSTMMSESFVTLLDEMRNQSGIEGADKLPVMI